MHEGEAHRLGALGVNRQGEILPEQRDAGAGLGRMKTGEDFDQRRLAGAVAAEQAVNLAATHDEVDVVERERPAEAFAEPFDDQRFSGAFAHLRPQSALKPAICASP